MNTHNGFALSLIAAAVLAAFSPSGMAAEEEEKTVAELATPSSTISGGIGYATDDARRFGQYNGINEEGAYLLLDIDYRRRIDSTGTWFGLQARNLGLDHRELRFDHNRQGDWGYFVELGQTPRHEPFQPITGLAGIGGPNQVINGAGGLRVIDLKTRRDTIGLGFDKIIAGGFDFQVRFKNEEKKGARIYGQGDSPGNPNTRFLTDPIDYTIRQWEAIASYTTQQLQLSAGYYGTSFDNEIPALFLTGTPAPIFTPMALPPGNKSHQLYLTGGYNITPTTRTSFKVAYTYQTQDEAFVAPAVAGRTNLDGRVDTKLAQIGFTAQPLPRLSLLANARYEDKHDKTPIFRYFSATPGSTLSGENEPRSFKTISGKAEAAYQLPYGFRVLGGVDYEEKDRNTFPIRSVSHRDETEEISYRAEVRRTIGETVTGALGYVHSDRDGSPFLTTITLGGGLGSNLIAPLHLADRERDKYRATVTWMVTDPVTLQLMVEEGKDRYDSRTPADLGIREGRMRNYTVDASYALSTAWQANAWYTRYELRTDQASVSGATTWGADIASDSNSLGVGVRGKPLTRLEVGADITYTNINDRFRVVGIAGPAPVSNIPDINTKLTTLQLFGSYALQKNMGVRLNYIYDRWQSDEWTWTSFIYTDGTRLIQEPSQKVHFIGVSAYYNFR